MSEFLQKEMFSTSRSGHVADTRYPPTRNHNNLKQSNCSQCSNLHTNSCNIVCYER